LPRTAQEQYDAGSPIPANAPLQPGDLVFFGQGATDVTHVGIYAGVQGDQAVMVDAPHGGAEVRVEAFPDVVGQSWGTEQFLGAQQRHRDRFLQLEFYPSWWLDPEHLSGIVDNVDDPAWSFEEHDSPASNVRHVDTWCRRWLLLEVGAGAVEPAVADDDATCVEHRALEERDRLATVARKFPGDTLRDHPGTAGARCIDKVRRPLAPYPVVGRGLLADLCGVVGQVGELVDHDVRGKAGHGPEQIIALEDVADDRLGADVS
jgi:hypothetical protein